MASEAEPSGDVAARLTALVLAAASEVVGASLASDVLRLPKERPRRARRASRGWDFACHAPATLFHRLVALAAANASRDDWMRSVQDQAKHRAVRQMEGYDTFKNMVSVAHLKPLQHGLKHLRPS